MNEVDFLHAESMNIFYKLILWFLIGMIRHSQNSQNSKFAMSLQYLKKEVRDEVDFLHADKHQSFLPVDFSTLAIKVSYKGILSFIIVIKVSKVISLQYLFSFSKKKVGMGFMQINIKVTISWHYHF